MTIIPMPSTLAIALVAVVWGDMGEFTFEIAGHSLAARCLFDSTAHYCARYPATGAPEEILTVSREELVAEQAFLDEEARQEGLKRRIFTDPFLERGVLQRKVAEYLRKFDILLLHGSTVSVDGRAFLFTAPCGTGKSTHTRLWREVFAQRAVMINDDKPFLCVSEGGVTAFGAPWSGKHGLNANISAPLVGICILNRGMDNRIAPMAPDEGMEFLKTQACSPCPEPLVEALLHTVHLWHMTCNKDPQAACMAYAAMAEGMLP